MNILDVEVGSEFTKTKKILESDVVGFSEISGDKNPVHLDKNYAEKSMFKGQIAHGLMSASYFSAIFGMDFPGPGCVYVAQNLKFLRPVYVNDTVVATAKITEVNPKKRRIYFHTVCKVNGKRVIDGEAEIFVPEKF